MNKMIISFELDGRKTDVLALPGANGVDFLKSLGIHSVRNSDDGEGFAGSDTILFNGKPALASLMVAGQFHEGVVKTPESLNEGSLSLIQQAMLETGVVQSAYNTPSAALLIDYLLSQSENPTKEEIQDAFSGLFNRATGYQQFFDCIRRVRDLKNGETGPFIIPTFREDLRVVGKGAMKVDGKKLVQGRNVFVEDRITPDTCYLKVLGSPHAHAYIKSINTSEAVKTEGVVAVFTHQNTPETYYTCAGQGAPEPSPHDKRLFSPKLRFIGDRVAAVLAESVEQAEKALKLIQVEYEILKTVLTPEEAAAEGAPLIQGGLITYQSGDGPGMGEAPIDPREGQIIYPFPIGADPRKNIAASTEGGIGDLEEGFRQSDVIAEGTYHTAQIQCTPLETHTVLTKMDGDRLIIHASTQVPWHLRRVVAKVLGIRENRIQVIKERVGGGYGSKQDILLEDLAAFATFTTGRTVFYRFTREEEFIANSTRHPMDIYVKAGATKDGKLQALYMDIVCHEGPFGNHCLTVPMNACSKSLPLFPTPHAGFKVTSYYSNIPPTGAYQGYGAPQGNYALHMALYELAQKLGMNPLELIEKNKVNEKDKLEILKSLGEGREGAAAVVESCGLEEALVRGKELMDWDTKETSDDPDVAIGKGVAIIQQGSGLPGLDHSCADIKLLSDGTFFLHSGGADLGTGLDTVCVKLASEVLKVDMEHVGILSGDTDNTPFDTGAYASSGTFFSGGAALRAAEDIKEKMLAEAALILEEKKESLTLEYPGVVKSPEKELTYAELAHHVLTGEGRGQIIGQASYTTEDSAFPYGAHFAQVAVNKRTGAVKVQKYIALQDSGTPINPELALGQIYGASLKTIGHSLSEAMILDKDGRCINPSLYEYGVPMIGDIPDDFQAHLIWSDDPFGPYGGKSISEVSCNGAAPALAGAIMDACGIVMDSWPFTPDKILRKLGKL